jgi:heat shock protein HslJ
VIGVDWVLETSSLGHLVAKVPPDLHIDLRFDAEQASGSAGCNTYGANFQAIGGSISFGPIRSTQIACEKAVMAAEAAYLRALESTTNYAAYGPTRSAPVPTLHLTGGAADLTFDAASPSVSPTPSPTQ